MNVRAKVPLPRGVIVCLKTRAFRCDGLFDALMRVSGYPNFLCALK